MVHGVVIVGTGQGGFQLAASLREQDWQKAQDQWLVEKLSAEALIRKLLGQLGGPAEKQSEDVAELAASIEGIPTAPHFLTRQPTASQPTDSVAVE